MVYNLSTKKNSTWFKELFLL